jgi:GTP-binding protein
MAKVTEIRNVAIIAHVDHGKTTLVDALLKQTHTFRANQEEMGAERIMDSNDLEREKGITILSKNTSVNYKGTKINIIDTPGHADFGGEVERVLNMADGALLIVDAAEGPLSQTRFVLKKALDYGLKIILVINKIDRKDADVARVMNDTEELFLNLASSSDTLDFPVVYAVGRDGKAFHKMPTSQDEAGDITPLLDTILSSIKPTIPSDKEPFKMLVSAFEPNQFLGRLAVGRVYQGKIKSGDAVVMLSAESKVEGNYRIGKMYVNDGISKVEVSEAESGDIVYLAGIDEIEIGHTLASPLAPQALPTIEVAPPTLKASFGPNSSMFAKGESRFLTSRELKERLVEEARTNLGMKVEMDQTDNIRMIVAGRGELHLAILIEKLRREGFALEVGKPEVILRKIEGQWQEPINELTILTTDEYVGTISAELGKRRGQMLDMVSDGKGGVKIMYKISEKNSLGLRTVLMTETKGTTAISSLFLGYEKMEENLARSRNGVMIATETGKALSYGLDLAQKRGITFVEPTELIYEGQIVGLRPVGGDLDINVGKGKQLTNMRSSGNDDAIILAPAVKYSIEECLDFIEEDELIDITPKMVRLRKKYLTKVDRTRAERKGSSN